VTISSPSRWGPDHEHEQTLQQHSMVPEAPSVRLASGGFSYSPLPLYSRGEGSGVVLECGRESPLWHFLFGCQPRLREERKWGKPAILARTPKTTFTPDPSPLEYKGRGGDVPPRLASQQFLDRLAIVQQMPPACPVWSGSVVARVDAQGAGIEGRQHVLRSVGFADRPGPRACRFRPMTWPICRTAAGEQA